MAAKSKCENRHLKLEELARIKILRSKNKLNQLCRKIKKYAINLPSKKSGCASTALEYRLKDRGYIYWVGGLLDKLGILYVVGHYYYIPKNTRLEDYALNHEDRGFGEYPKLTVEEVLYIGEFTKDI